MSVGYKTIRYFTFKAPQPTSTHLGGYTPRSPRLGGSRHIPPKGGIYVHNPLHRGYTFTNPLEMADIWTYKKYILIYLLRMIKTYRDLLTLIFCFLPEMIWSEKNLWKKILIGNDF